MRSRRALAPFVAVSLQLASLAAAQGLARITVTLSLPDAGSAVGTRVDLVSSTGLPIATAVADGRGLPISLVAPPGSYRVRVTGSGRFTEHNLAVGAGEVISLDVRLGGAVSEPAVVEADRFARASQIAFDTHTLHELPHSRSASSLLETSHPFLVTDRIDGGGLTTGERTWIGGSGSSATQTTFRVNGLDVTDPDVTGTSLFYPDPSMLQSILVQSADADAAATGAGPVIDLAVAQPAVAWSGEAQVSAASGALLADAAEIPPIARLTSWLDGNVAAGGALGRPTARLFAAGRVTNTTRVEREQLPELDGKVRAFTVHVTSNPVAGRAIALLASTMGLTRPRLDRGRFADRDLSERDRTTIVHGTWGRTAFGAQWLFTGAYQRANRDADSPLRAAGGVIERVQDGPPLALAEMAIGSRERWTVAARATPAARRWLGTDHLVDAGATLSGADAESLPETSLAFGELVNGRPARVWDVARPASGSRRATTTFGAFVSDHLPLGDLVSVTAALRLDADRAEAEGGAGHITWTHLSPRVGARWRPLGDRSTLAVTSSYGWYRHRLPLGVLAVGDPAGPAGVMYRWDDGNADGEWTPSELTAVAAVGAGLASNAIDPDLRRPTTREFRLGAEQAIGAWRWGVTGVDRREDELLALINTGVTPADYTVAFIDDPGVDIAGASGSAPLPIYNRRPESFLRDRYLLTNTTADASRFQSFEITLARDLGTRWLVRFGGTAYRSEGAGASRGYRPDENDQGLLGEAFATPNAATFARGRLFYDRAYMMKVLGAYTASRILRASLVARYQDGQPFSRLVLADGLNQGRDLVQTYSRGGQRFTYTLTLDARVEARWPFNQRRGVGFVLEAFNLLNTANEVEEDIVTGPSFRAISAVQPPRVIRLGVRAAF